MTYGDVLMQIASEATGQSRESLSPRFELLKKIAPESNLEQELPDHIAEQLLKDLRNEQIPILQRLFCAANS